MSVWYCHAVTHIIYYKGPFINDVTEKGGGGVPPKGDQKMTGGEGGYLQKVTSFMNKSI